MQINLSTLNHAIETARLAPTDRIALAVSTVTDGWWYEILRRIARDDGHIEIEHADWLPLGEVGVVNLERGDVPKLVDCKLRFRETMPA